MRGVVGRARSPPRTENPGARRHRAIASSPPESFVLLVRSVAPPCGANGEVVAPPAQDLCSVASTSKFLSWPSARPAPFSGTSRASRGVLTAARDGRSGMYRVACRCRCSEGKAGLACDRTQCSGRGRGRYQAFRCRNNVGTPGRDERRSPSRTWQQRVMAAAPVDIRLRTSGTDQVAWLHPRTPNGW